MTCSVSHLAFRAKQRKLLDDEIATKKSVLAFKVPRLHLKNFFFTGIVVCCPSVLLRVMDFRQHLSDSPEIILLNIYKKAEIVEVI